MRIETRNEQTNPPVTIERIAAPRSSSGLVSAGAETEDAFVLGSGGLHAALHTSRGWGNEEWNDEAGALFVGAEGEIYVGVFDQAAAPGRHPREHGGASALAAKYFFRRMRRLAIFHREDCAQALKEAGWSAHEAIAARGYQEASTFLGAVVQPTEAVVLVTGDSEAMHFRGDGRLVAATAQHRIPAPFPQQYERQALGQLEGELLQDEYHWPLQHGDWLVFTSDGLMDAGVKPEEIGAIVSSASGALAATRGLREEACQRMEERRAQPENLTIIVVRVD